MLARFFFATRSLHPRDLHSFPTRRSSDLRTLYSLVARPALWRLSLRHNSRIFQHASPLTILNTLCHERRLQDVVLDRKSTRLNSSHVAISYAVFCLKK